MSRHPRIVAVVVGACYAVIGWVFVWSETLDAWPSHDHWGGLMLAAGLSAWWYAWRPSRASVSASGTMLVAAMTLRAVVLAVELLTGGFEGPRRDTAVVGAVTATAVALLVWVVWVRLLTPAQAWRAHR